MRLNIILVLWLGFVLYGAVWIVENIPPEFGEIWGSLFILYLFLVVIVAFIGRWIIVKVINYLITERD